MSTRPVTKIEITPDSNEGVCRSPKCRKRIMWVPMPSGKRLPVDPDGTPHWATCVDAESFRKTKPTP